MDLTKSKAQEKYDDLSARFKAAVQEKAEASLQVAQLQKALDKASARYAQALSLEDQIKRQILELP